MSRKIIIPDPIIEIPNTKYVLVGVTPHFRGIDFRKPWMLENKNPLKMQGFEAESENATQNTWTDARDKRFSQQLIKLWKDNEAYFFFVYDKKETPVTNKSIPSAWFVINQIEFENKSGSIAGGWHAHDNSDTSGVTRFPINKEDFLKSLLALRGNMEIKGFAFGQTSDHMQQEIESAFKHLADVVRANDDALDWD